MKPLKRVAQRDWEHDDCGLACVAMVAGVSYEDALKAFRKLEGKATTKNFATNHKQVEAMLVSLGISTRRTKFNSWHKIESHAIVKVNPRKSGGWHWVVFDAARTHPTVHDPKPGHNNLVCDFRGLKGNGFYIAVVSV